MGKRQNHVFYGDPADPGVGYSDWWSRVAHSKRSVRRHHRERLLEKRKHYYGGDWSEGVIGKLVNTATPCSCWMCGNPRKYTGERTLQERKAELDFKKG